MGMLGFSVNMLTLFGLVLAIGIVVDDAIVIVENAVHHIDRDKLPPQEATIKAMSEVIGPVIGITLVLDGRVPPDRLPRRDHGPALSPVRPDHRRHRGHRRHQRRDPQARPVCGLSPTDQGGRRTSSTASFNAVYDRCEAIYAAIVRRLVRHVVADDAPVRGAWSASPAGGSSKLPTGFLPTEDQGYAIVGIQLPDAASQTRTRAVVDKVERRSSGRPRGRRAGS